MICAGEPSGIRLLLTPNAFMTTIDVARLSRHEQPAVKVSVAAAGEG